MTGISTDKKKRPIKSYLLIFISAFLLFCNTIPHEYAWDDKIVIENNPRVKKGINGIPDLFVKYNSDFQYDKYGYRPVTLTSFAIDYTISKGNPHFSHFINVLFFAILCVVIFRFVSSLFPDWNPMITVIITLLFAVHPLHVEVVANIKSRDEILSMLFGILSLTAFLQFIKLQKWKYLIFVALTYLLSYFSKENSITLLGIYPLLFVVHKSKFITRTAIVYVTGAVMLFIISFIFYRYTETSVAGIDESKGMGTFHESGILGNSFLMVGTLDQKIANALHVLILYLKNFLIPYPLLYYYGYNVIPVTSWNNPIVWISLFIHAATAFVGIKFRKQRPEILFGFFFYLVSISVFTHVLRPLSDTMADRFVFFASLGLCMCFAGFIHLVLRTTATSTISLGKFTQSNKIYSVICVCTCIIWASLTVQRNTVWKDDMTLVKHDMPYLENCSRAHYYYATLLKKQILSDKSIPFGSPKRNKLEQEMIEHYNKSISISDAAYMSYLELGSYYVNMQRWDKAIPLLQKATQLFPDAADINFILGQAYVNMYQNQAAIPYLEKSKSIAYNEPKNYYMLSLAYSRSNRFNDAINTANEGLSKFKNEQAMFYDALGFIYFEHDSLDRSIEYTMKMKDHGKSDKDIYTYIIQRCYMKGDSIKGNNYLKEAQLKGIVFNK